MKTNELITKIRSVMHMVAPPARELLEQAAEALEECRMHSAGCRMKWIPVTERLPESDSHVLAIVSGHWRNITFDHSYELASWSSDEGWIIDAWPEFGNPDIAHWMSLPEPPKEGD